MPGGVSDPSHERRCDQAREADVGLAPARPERANHATKSSSLIRLGKAISSTERVGTRGPPPDFNTAPKRRVNCEGLIKTIALKSSGRAATANRATPHGSHDTTTGFT